MEADTLNLLCPHAQNESQLFHLSRVQVQCQKWVPSEVRLHMGHHLWRTGSRSGGISKLGGVGQLQFLEPLYIIVTQGQKLHVTLLHWVGLLLLDPGIPSDVIIHPQFQVTHAGNWIQNPIDFFCIEGVFEFVFIAVN